MATATSTLEAAPRPADATPSRWAVRARHVAIPAVVVAAIVVVGIAIGHDEVPTWLDAHVMPAIDRLYHWTVINNDRNWLFTGVFSNVSDAVKRCTEHMLSVLQILRWPGVLALTGVVGLRTSGLRAACGWRTR